MKPTNKGGWFNEPRNHGLAAKGIKVRPNKTDYKKNMMNKKDDIKYSGSPRLIKKLQTKTIDGEKIEFEQRYAGDFLPGKYQGEVYVQAYKDNRGFAAGKTIEEAEFNAKQYMKIYKNQFSKFSKEESDIMKIDEALKKNNLKFYAVIHSKDYPDDAKTYILENTEMARLTAKNEKDAKKQIKEKFGGGILEVSEITDKKEVLELKKLLLKNIGDKK